MTRVQVKSGNGLTKNMNQTLRSYDQIPVIITRTVGYLATMESLFDFSGAVRIDTMDLYKNLMDIHDDWVEEFPRLGRRSEHQVFADRLMEAIETGAMPPQPEGTGTVEFSRVPQLPFHQFTAAWTIARRIGVIEGRGEIGLSRTALEALKRLTAASETAAS
jgi:hypothetical protein